MKQEEIKQVLIVEDELVSALALKLIIEELGFSVCGIVTKGRDAIAQACSMRPDLILMDVFLADSVDGINAVEEIHETINIPVIYITASTDPATFKRAERTTMLAYIRKPYSIQDVKDTINGVLI
ncbi:MAG: response regulator [bacterium]|nr:response regulator [bacterium]